MTVELIRASGSDADVAHAAWVSTMGANAESAGDPERVDGLIKYLMRNRHGSPFEHCVMTFFVSAPIFVWREHTRHRMASYNEQSGRYSKLEPVFYMPAVDRPLVQTGKPGAYEFVPGSDHQISVVNREIAGNSVESYCAYLRLINQGVAKEVARMVLPVNIYSSAYVTMNLRGLMNFLSLRTKNTGAQFPSYPQHEIELVANAYADLFKEKYPAVYYAFAENGYVCP